MVLLGVLMKLALGLKQRPGVLPAETAQQPAPPLPVIFDQPTGEVAPALDVVQLKARLAAAVEAKVAAEVRLLANYPAWLVALDTQYRLRRADQLEPLQDWSRMRKLIMMANFRSNRSGGECKPTTEPLPRANG